ncbi:Core-2/I-Branching enzyme [Cooperia oncophora]
MASRDIDFVFGRLILHFYYCLQNYDFLEEVMAMMYSPLHFYCFVIDSSASPRFEELVRTLGRCVLNIIVPPNTYDTSTARGTFLAINSCYVGMEDFPWRHTIISEESEIPIHSVHYIADNAKRLRDAARIGRVTISEEHARILGDDDFFQSQPPGPSWLDNRRFPLVLPRSFQIPLLKFVGGQNFENCQVSALFHTKSSKLLLSVCACGRPS